MNGFCVIAVIRASRSKRVSEVLAENTTVTAPRIAMKIPKNSTLLKRSFNRSGAKKQLAIKAEVPRGATMEADANA